MCFQSTHAFIIAQLVFPEWLSNFRQMTPYLNFWIGWPDFPSFWILAFSYLWGHTCPCPPLNSKWVDICTHVEMPRCIWMSWIKYKIWIKEDQIHFFFSYYKSQALIEDVRVESYLVESILMSFKHL